MTVLTQILNGSTGGEVRETLNDLFNQRDGINLKPNAAPALAQAFYDCMDGITPARLVVPVISDSIGANIRGSSDVKSKSWVSRMTAKLQAMGLPVATAGMFGTNGMAAITDLSVYDPRWQRGAGLALSNIHSLGGYGLDFGAATAPSVFTPSEPYDAVDLWFVGKSTAADVTYQVAGQSAVTFTMPANGFSKVTVTKPLGQEAITFSKGASSGGILQIVDPYNTTVPRIRFANMGRTGWSAVDWNVATGTYSPFNALRTFLPLTIWAALGANAWRSTPVDPVTGLPAETPALFKSGMQAIIDKNKDKCPFILTVPPPGDITAYPSQGLYKQAIRELAASNNYGAVDFDRTFESFEAAGGSATTGDFADTTHPKSSWGATKMANTATRGVLKLTGLG